MIINSEIGGVSSNSYVSLEFATTYFTGHVNGQVWLQSGLETESLIQATTLLDSLMVWSGVKYTTAQALAFPRDDGVIPIELKNAVCELAVHLVSNMHISGAMSDDSISAIKLGSISIEMNRNSPVTALPHIVTSMVAHLGTCKSGSGGTIHQPKLVRV